MNQALQDFSEQVGWYWRQLRGQFLAHDCLTSAGALTYTTLFAVVPMMTVAYSMFSLLPEFSGISERVQTFIFENFVPDSSALVQDKLLEFSERARDLTLVGFVFLFVTAFMMLVSIEKAFNAIWNVPEPRRGLSRFLLYWGVLTLGPPLIAGGLFISLYLVSLPLFSDFDRLGISALLLRYLPLISGTGAFTVLYFAVPNCHVPFRHALFGGLVTAAGLEIAKFLFTTLVKRSSIEPIYGTFATVPLFLIWLYLVWVLVLAGAVLVRTLSLRREPDEPFREPLLVKGARVLQLLYAAHLAGESLSDEALRETVSLTSSEQERLFGQFAELKLLSQTEDERWILRRSLKGLTLWELYRRFPEGVDKAALDRVQDLPHVVEPLRALVQFGSNEMSRDLESILSHNT